MSEWTAARRFVNTNEESRVYDEHYRFTDQLGIRFGNGIYGKIPALHSQVKVELSLTDGDTTLLPNQPLAILDQSAEGLELETATSITGGQPVEDTETLRRNALYYFLYDEDQVWERDFKFFIRRKHPAILWLAVWGEQEQEQMTGVVDAKNINTIFVSAYAPGMEGLDATVLGTLRTGVKDVNTKFAWLPPDEQPCTIAINGKLRRDIGISDATEKIMDALGRHYGKDSRDKQHKSAILIQDVYGILMALNIFEPGASLPISIDGTAEPQNLRQMVFMNEAETRSALSLSY